MLRELHIFMLASGLVAGAVMATAQTAERGPECNWDVATQSFADAGLPAWVAPGGNNFATTLASDDDGLWNILHHCPSANYLVFYTSNADWPAVESRYVELMQAETGYTMRQFGEEVALLGAQARVGQDDIGRCDCAFLQSINALK